MVKPKEIDLHPKQFEAFSFTTQFCAAIAGVRGGKTYVGAVWAGNKIATTPGNGLITGPDYKTLQSATLPTFFSLFPGYRKYYKEQKSVIEIPNGLNPDGSKKYKLIFIRSMDDPLSPEGITADWAWADEAGKYKLLAWTVLRSRVSLARGQVLLTTTPYDMGWLYQEFYKPWMEKTDPDYTVVSWASIDNPYFPKEVYESEKRRLKPAEFKRRYEGVFSRMQGLVYEIKPYYIIDEFPQRSDIVIGGVDWGWTNPAALSVVKIYDGKYYIIDEWYEVGKTTGQIIEAAISLQNKWGVNRWYADSANPEKIAEANQDTGLVVHPYEKKKDSITAGVSAINQLMLDNRFYVHRGLKHHFSEYESYQYPPEGDDGLIRKDEPMPFNNHLMDADRYAVMGYQPAMRARVPDPNESFTQVSVRRMLTGNTNAGLNQGGDDFI
jgi:hypothetical protein